MCYIHLRPDSFRNIFILLYLSQTIFATSLMFFFFFAFLRLRHMLFQITIIIVIAEMQNNKKEKEEGDLKTERTLLL